MIQVIFFLCFLHFYAIAFMQLKFAFILYVYSIIDYLIGINVSKYLKL